MKIIFLSLCTVSLLMGVSGDSQSILNEVSKLRQKYDECRESQGVVKGIDPKLLAQIRSENQKLMVEVTRKEGVIKSLEHTMQERDRSYRETNARNKSLIAQLHTQNVTGQEREMLKRALLSAKAELALAQKELRGGSSSIVKVREELKATKENLVKLQATLSKTQPTEKILALQTQLNTANTVISQLRSTPQKTQAQQPQVIYKDRTVTQEKIVYKDRLVEKVVEKIVYKDRPIEKIVEKIVTKTIIQEKPIVDEVTRRKMDKLALDLERQKSLNLKLTNDLAKVSPKRIVAAALPPLPLTNPRPAVKTIVAQPIKTAQVTVENTTVSSKKSSGVYRMASDASIYSSPNGKVVDTWEARRSFTGGVASNGWIHITGYFVNRVFQGMGEGENLWVKENDTIPR